jgi:hypothetical protein
VITRYILCGRRPVRVDNILEWTAWQVLADRAGDYLVGRWQQDGALVSTVFLGSNLCMGPGPPLVFETAIFRAGKDTEIVDRYSTWEDAEAGHMAACAAVREQLMTEEGR